MIFLSYAEYVQLEEIRTLYPVSYILELQWGQLYETVNFVFSCKVLGSSTESTISDTSSSDK